MDTNVHKLAAEVQRLQCEEGVKALHVYRDGDKTATQEEVAGGILKLMTGSVVSDPEVF